MVDIFVSKDSLQRALRVAGRIFNAIENRGHRVKLAPFNENLWRPDLEERKRYWEWSWDRWCPDRPTVAYIGTVTIGLTLYETYETQTGRWRDGKWFRVSRPRDYRPGLRFWEDPIETRRLPTGLFVLRAFSPYPNIRWMNFWSEAKRGELVAKAGSIAEEIEGAAPTVAALAEAERIRVEQWRQKLEDERRERERQEMERRRAQALKDSHDQLLAIVNTWALANNIEAFFADLANRTARVESEEERRVLLTRIERARELLGGTDALQHFRSWKSPDER